MVFTCQMVTEFVPPWMESWNCWVVTTFTETVAGEIVTLMFVTGSVQVDVVVVVEEVEVVVVHVTAVLVAVEPHEARPKREVSRMKQQKAFHRASLFIVRYSRQICFRLNPDPQNVKSILDSRILPALSRRSLLG